MWKQLRTVDLVVDNVYSRGESCYIYWGFFFDYFFSSVLSSAMALSTQALEFLLRGLPISSVMLSCLSGEFGWLASDLNAGAPSVLIKVWLGCLMVCVILMNPSCRLGMVSSGMEAGVVNPES